MGAGGPGINSCPQNDPENDEEVHTKRKAACVATSGPKSREDQEGSDSGVGLGARIPLALGPKQGRDAW
jgi:hypothetical protein